MKVDSDVLFMDNLVHIAFLCGQPCSVLLRGKYITHCQTYLRLLCVLPHSYTLSAATGEADLAVHHLKQLLSAGVGPSKIAMVAPYNLQVLVAF